MIVKCPNCAKPIGKEDRRKSRTGIPTEMMEGSLLQLRDRSAPRLKCGHCRKTIILVKASAI